MTTNTENSGSSKFKSIQNDGFGASVASTLIVGDLVSWDSWTESLETGVFEEKNGVLMGIYRNDRGYGWGYMAKIMPFGKEKEIHLPLISIRKSALRN
tara:strand:- start:664 stop:957 length:294 start_codon:yes stop_codon:yes gene_type:complete